jgi:hypothetical protein
MSGEQLTMPTKKRRRSHEEYRPARAGQQPRQHRQHYPVGGLEIGAVHLAAQHCHLVAEYQDLDILGAAVAGELGQHLQDLAQEELHQRGGHGYGHDGCAGLALAQNRTSDGRTGYSSPTPSDATVAALMEEHRDVRAGETVSHRDSRGRSK